MKKQSVTRLRMSSPLTSPSSDNYTTCEQSVNLTNRYSKTGAKWGYCVRRPMSTWVWKMP